MSFIHESHKNKRLFLKDSVEKGEDFIFLNNIVFVINAKGKKVSLNIYIENNLFVLK